MLCGCTRDNWVWVCCQFGGLGLVGLALQSHVQIWYKIAAPDSTRQFYGVALCFGRLLTCLINPILSALMECAEKKSVVLAAMLSTVGALVGFGMAENNPELAAGCLITALIAHDAAEQWLVQMRTVAHERGGQHAWQSSQHCTECDSAVLTAGHVTPTSTGSLALADGVVALLIGLACLLSDSAAIPEHDAVRAALAIGCCWWCAWAMPLTINLTEVRNLERSGQNLCVPYPALHLPCTVPTVPTLHRTESTRQQTGDT